MDDTQFQTLVLEHLSKLTGEINSIKSTMATKNELDGIKATMATKDELNDIRTNMATKNELSDIKAATATREDLHMLNQAVAKLENALVPKVQVLFDGWQQHQDCLDRITEQLDRVEDKLEHLDLTVARIVSVQEHQSAMLDVLSTRTTHQEAEISLLKRAR